MEQDILSSWKERDGKDTLYKEILKKETKAADGDDGIQQDRSGRRGRTGGIFLYRSEELERQLASGKVIESRTYQTIAGPWTYTVDDGQFNVADDESCLMIGTLESYEKMCTLVESGKMVPVYTRSRTGSGFSGPSNARKTRKAELPGSLPEIPCRRKDFQRKIWNA